MHKYTRYLWVLSLLAIVGAGILTFSYQVENAQAGGTWNQSDYWFRDDDGSESTATGYGPTDIVKNNAITGVGLSTALRLRFGLRDTVQNGTIIPRLEYQAGTNCAATSTWTPITATSPNFTLSPSSFFQDGNPTTKQITNGAFIAGKIFETSNPGPAANVARNRNTEYEWSLLVSGAASYSTVYAFRVTDNGTPLNTYTLCPNLTTGSAPAVPITKPVSSLIRQSTANFSGKAFPGAQVTLLEKLYEQNIILAQGIAVEDSGNFRLEGIPTGYHAYGLIVKDKDGRSTATKLFNQQYINDSFTAENILMSPTVDAVPTAVTVGQPITIVGSAYPGSNVEINLDDTKTFNTTADDQGAYTLAVTTSDSALGSHTVRSRQTTPDGQISDYSLSRTFSVSATTIVKADFDNDGVVDIKDWSIFLAYWNQTTPEAKQLIDLNGDGKVDISDVSIFLKAFKK